MPDNDFGPLVYMAHHDPAIILGLLLIGSSAVFFIHIQFKMIKAGYKSSYTFFKKPLSPNGWDSPGQYLKVRAEHNWSPWPVYFLGLSLLIGTVVLVFGLLRL
jgi:hypothetical protein